MLPAILLASLISLFAIADASAQNTRELNAQGFRDLPKGRIVAVFDGAGAETRGRVIDFTVDSVVIEGNGHDITFDRKNVAAIFERGNSMQKGLFAGVAVAASLVVAVAMTDGLDDDYAAAGAGLLSLLAIGGGVAIDAAIPGKRLLYAHPTSYVRGDSNRSGLILGLVAGGASGLIAGLRKDDCDHTPPGGYPYFDCRADEKWANGGKVGAMTGLVGAGLGLLIDRMHVGERFIYGASLAPSRLSLTTSVSW